LSADETGRLIDTREYQRRATRTLKLRPLRVKCDELTGSLQAQRSDDRTGTRENRDAKLEGAISVSALAAM
jgi:hypothetical protein